MLNDEDEGEPYCRPDRDEPEFAYCDACRCEIEEHDHDACVDAGSTLDLCPKCAELSVPLGALGLSRADMLAAIRRASS